MIYWSVMGRNKAFDKNELLEKAMMVFWRHGYAHSSLSDLEAATNVRRSSLYAEFSNKDDLFLEALKYYMESVGILALLHRQPLGWKNLEEALLLSEENRFKKGCFGTNCISELQILPKKVQSFLKTHVENVRMGMEKNLLAIFPTSNVSNYTDLLMTMNSGIALKQNMKGAPSSRDLVKQLLKFIRQNEDRFSTK